jgi:P27 family predicted phage terminase small subunit
MKTGPAPKPTAIRELQGRAHRKANRREPRPALPGRPPYAPRWLCPEGQAAWRRIAGALLDVGLYTTIDHVALEGLCEAYGRWRQASEELGRAGAGMVTEGERGSVVSAWERVAERRFDQVRKMLAEFGMTPAQRSRVSTAEASQMSLAELLFSDVLDGDRDGRP